MAGVTVSTNPSQAGSHACRQPEKGHRYLGFPSILLIHFHVGRNIIDGGGEHASFILFIAKHYIAYIQLEI